MSPLREVSNSVDFAQRELDVLARWQRDRTFERSLERRADAPRFVFYDGPPFATGLPHYGHILTSFIKDVVPRYQTMRGYHVPRRWGWDCHGLPVELEVEKALGVSSPADIARVGVAAFNDACKNLVMRYAAEWETIVTRLGRWVDFAGAYRTMDPAYTESVVWCFAELHARGLVYEGKKVVAYCTRCQTALSNFETRLDDAYRERDDLAVTVRFPLAGAPDQAILAWTTTPWTLPANAALAVHPALDYVRLADGDTGASLWLAAEAVPRYASRLAGFVERERRRGDALVGLAYRPPFDAYAATPGAFRVLAADWVTADDGTGVVHLAPAFGEADHATCSAAGLAGFDPVRDDGTFDDRVAGLEALAGLDVFAANEPVAAQLAARGLLFARQTVRHDYPHCWRCDRPLVYRAIPSWFVKVTALKDRLVANNREIHWVPAHAGEKRFADWLEGARDWAVSRNRFWGAPVPVWRCAGCAATSVVAGRAELEQHSGQVVADWHRPAIDQVVWPCACGGELRRVPDVLDCWFESGAMPYASEHYPFAGAAQFRASFPGDFIVEYVAQTRGWFYTMLVLSTALFDAPPFQHAVCHGVLLGEDGRKLGKRLRNYPDPMELVGEHGSDALRAALLMSGAVAGNDVKFSAASVRDGVRRLHLPLWNALHLYTAYATLDGFEPTGDLSGAGRLDRALTSEAELLRADVERAMDGYDFARAYEVLEDFITTLTTWYLRLAKPVLWSAGLSPKKRATYEALHAAFAQLARVAAPFLPFVAELVHEALGGEDSVHLEDWPAPRDALRDDALVGEMRRLREVVRLARRAREQAGVKHRQPLRRAWVAGMTLDADRELLAGELNVKAVEVLASAEALVHKQPVLDYARLGKRLRGKVKAVAAAVAEGHYAVRADGGLDAAGEVIAAGELGWRSSGTDQRGVAVAGDLVVALDLAVDDVLAREAVARELGRAVQDLRKRARLGYGDRVQLAVVGLGEPLDASLREHAAWLIDQCGATSLGRAALAGAIAETSLELDGAGSVTVAIAHAG